MVSPIPFAARNDDRQNGQAPLPSRANSPTAPDAADEFPGYLVCSITQEPPVRGCRFNIPTPGGSYSPCVFEFSELIRYISTRGNLRASSRVKHPMLNAFVLRVNARACIAFVSAEEQARIHQERIRLGMGIVESNPLTQADQIRYNDMIAELEHPGR